MSIFNDIDTALFDQFPSRHFKIRHQLMDNPLFELSSLVELAKQLPTEQIEWNVGELGISQDPTKTPANGLSPEETVAQIKNNKSWLVMKNVQAVPAYRDILHECLAEVEAKASGRLTGLCDRAGFIFISSPGSVTPFHIDPEHNFLMQLSGHKTMHLFDRNEKSVISEEHIENTYTGEHQHRNLEYRDEFKSLEHAVELTPGEAVHVPIHAPHWVKNGSDVSISFSITFRSEQSKRAVRIQSLNGRLRSKGFSPKPVGSSDLSDTVKDCFMRTAVSAKKLLKPERA